MALAAGRPRRRTRGRLRCFCDGVEHSGVFQDYHALSIAMDILGKVGAVVHFYSTDVVYVNFRADVEGQRHSCIAVGGGVVEALKIAICHAYNAGLTIEDFQ